MLPIVVQCFAKFVIQHGIIEFLEQQDESTDTSFTNIKYVLEANELKLNQLVLLGSDNNNVNVGNNHSVFALFHKLLPHIIKGKCYSHILHNSVKHRNKYLLLDVESALLKIYDHFCRSSVCSQELAKYFDFVQQEQKFVFVVLGSNEFCELVFSHIKYLWDNNRNRMKHDLNGAELKIKMNTHHICAQFYDYLLNKPVLLKQIRSSDEYIHISKMPRIVY